jgi:hypothetical protein
MSRVRRSSQAASPTDAVTLVRAATVARHGGSSSARLVNLTNHIRIKKKLSDDYIPKSGTVIKRNNRKPLAGPGLSRDDVQSDLDAHCHAIEAIRHFLKHGDSCGLSKLANAMTFKPRRQSFIDWCSRHTQLRWDKASQVFKKHPSAKTGTLAAAIADSFRLPRDPAAGTRELQRLHEQAVTAVRRASDHGDWTMITGLAEALSSQRRGKQLKRWFEQFGEFQVNSGRLAFYVRRPVSPTELAAATNRPYFELRTSNTTCPPDPEWGLATVMPKCKVCGGPAMPGEDTCYRDQSE